MNLTGYLIVIGILTVINLMVSSYYHGKPKNGEHHISEGITSVVIQWMLIWIFLL